MSYGYGSRIDPEQLRKAAKMAAKLLPVVVGGAKYVRNRRHEWREAAAGIEADVVNVLASGRAIVMLRQGHSPTSDISGSITARMQVMDEARADLILKVAQLDAKLSAPNRVVSAARETLAAIEEYSTTLTMLAASNGNNAKLCQQATRQRQPVEDTFVAFRASVEPVNRRLRSNVARIGNHHSENPLN
jgi:hypothetical protein